MEDLAESKSAYQPVSTLRLILHSYDNDDRLQSQTLTLRAVDTSGNAASGFTEKRKDNWNRLIGALRDSQDCQIFAIKDSDLAIGLDGIGSEGLVDQFNTSGLACVDADNNLSLDNMFSLYESADDHKIFTDYFAFLSFEETQEGLGLKGDKSHSRKSSPSNNSSQSPPNPAPEKNSENSLSSQTKSEKDGKTARTQSMGNYPKGLHRALRRGQWETKTLIGAGEEGQVFKVTYQGKAFALKTSSGKAANRVFTKEVWREKFNTLAALSSISGVSKLVATCLTAEGQIQYLFELGGPSTDALWSKKIERPESLASSDVLSQRLLTITLNMLNLGYAHKDLKPANVILDSEQKSIVIVDTDGVVNLNQSVEGISVDTGITPSFRSPYVYTFGLKKWTKATLKHNQIICWGFTALAFKLSDLGKTPDDFFGALGFRSDVNLYALLANMPRIFFSGTLKDIAVRLMLNGEKRELSSVEQAIVKALTPLPGIKVAKYGPVDSATQEEKKIFKESGDSEVEKLTTELATLLNVSSSSHP